MNRRGFTLIELLVVIAIIAILAAILFPVFISAKQSAHRTQCMSNMRQIGIAINRYADDWNGCTPYTHGFDGSMWWDANTWRERILPYTRSKMGRGVLHCPVQTWWKTKYGVFSTGSHSKDVGHYGISSPLTFYYSPHPGYVSLSSEVQVPTKTILVAENRDGDWAAEPLDNTGNFNEAGQFYPYHSSGTAPGGVFIFCDGHAKCMSVLDTQKNNFYYWQRVKY